MIDESTCGIGFAWTIPMHFEISIIAIVSFFALVIKLFLTLHFRWSIVESNWDCIVSVWSTGFWFRKQRRKPPEKRFAIPIYQARATQVDCGSVCGNQLIVVSLYIYISNQHSSSATYHSPRISANKGDEMRIISSKGDDVSFHFLCSNSNIHRRYLSIRTRRGHLNSSWRKPLIWSKQVKGSFISMTTDTFALTLNISKQRRGDKKHLKRERRFEMQSNLLAIQNVYGLHAPSIQIGRHSITTATQSQKHSYHYLQGQMRETDWRSTSGHLPHCYLFTERRKIRSALSPAA